MSVRNKNFRVHIRDIDTIEIEALLYRIEDGVLKLQEDGGHMIGPSPFCLPIQLYKEVAIFKEWLWVEVVDTSDKAK